jgi:hypothetical protein
LDNRNSSVPEQNTVRDPAVLPLGPVLTAAQWTGALRNAGFFACANNYLFSVKFGTIMDVEPRAVWQAEVGTAQTRIQRAKACSGIDPE